MPKGRPRMAQNGRVFTPAKTRDYERLVSKTAGVAVCETGWEPIVGHYAVEVIVQRARAVGDLDNYLKAVCDGMNGVVWPDDAMVTQIHAKFANGDRKYPGVWVRISRGTPIPGDSFGFKNTRDVDVDGIRAGGKDE